MVIHIHDFIKKGRIEIQPVLSNILYEKPDIKMAYYFTLNNDQKISVK